MGERNDRRSSMGSSTDEPPNSRLFVVGSKLLCEDDYREAFHGFGRIEEIWIVKDRQTKENKGITYIKFSKTTEAARALEAMNGKSIGNINRSIRVLIAASRDQGSKRDSNEEERIQRLFVVVPKWMTDTELYDYFIQFGDLEYANIMRDRDTRESKGFAYVKYFKFSHAALAFEECDRKYKPVFAEPKKSSVRYDDRPLPSPWGSLPKLNHALSQDNSGNGFHKLVAIVSPLVNQDQLWKLFDIAPGLDYCQLRLEGRPRPNRGVASVVYKSAQAAAYALEKIHGLEYPPGSRVILKPDYDGRRNNFENTNKEEPKQPDIFQIAETLAQATNLIQAAGLPRELLQVKLGLAADPKNDVFCNVKLPDPQPVAPIDQQTAARCFIVCTSSPPPNSVLRDVFSRFGNLIDVYMLNNRNCGFAKYATAESAENAILALHGAEICGVRVKVLKAEEREDHVRKRQRLDDNKNF